MAGIIAAPTCMSKTGQVKVFVSDPSGQVTAVVGCLNTPPKALSCLVQEGLSLMVV